MTRGKGKVIRDYGLAIAIAVTVALLIRAFVIEAYRIPTEAMKPTLLPGDTIFVAKWPFGLRLPFMNRPVIQGRLPARGEVVLFSAESEPGYDYLKRVVGLPGDTIEVRRGRVHLNGAPLDSRPLAGSGPECTQEILPAGPHAPQAKAYGVCAEAPFLETQGPQRVPEGSVFVLGDFRSEAPRSRGWGIFPMSSIKGSALWIWLSIQPQSGADGAMRRFRKSRMFRRIE